MNKCLHCKKPLRKFTATREFPDRKYHKKCWNELRWKKNLEELSEASEMDDETMKAMAVKINDADNRNLKSKYGADSIITRTQTKHIPLHKYPCLFVSDGEEGMLGEYHDCYVKV